MVLAPLLKLIKNAGIRLNFLLNPLKSSYVPLNVRATPTTVYLWANMEPSDIPPHTPNITRMNLEKVALFNPTLILHDGPH
jgi:hypothetical protein